MFMLREGVRKGALSLFIPVAKDAFRRTIGWVLRQKHGMLTKKARSIDRAF